MKIDMNVQHPYPSKLVRVETLCGTAYIAEMEEEVVRTVTTIEVAHDKIHGVSQKMSPTKFFTKKYLFEDTDIDNDDEINRNKWWFTSIELANEFIERKNK
jgi:hypothetical protein